MILYHTKEFESHKNNHNINVFMLKAHYVKETSSDQPFDCSMDFFKNARKVVTPIRKVISSLDMSLDKHFDQINSIPSELISLIGLITGNNSSSRNVSQSTLTIAGLIVYSYKKGTHKRESAVDKVSINQLRKRETAVITYISLKLYSSIRSKTLLQKLHQIGICTSYQHVIDIISDWAGNALRVYKNSNLVIPLKLRGMVFTVFTKDNIDKNSKSNEASKHFHGTSICAFQTMKSVDEGIVRRSSQNDLVGTVSDFSLPQAYTNVPPLLKECKKYSCALPTINIPEDIWCELILKDHQNEEVIWMEKFLSAETTAKHAWSSYHAGKKRVPTSAPSYSSIFPLLKDVVHTPDMQHHLIKLCIEYTNPLNPQQVTAVDCSEQPIYALSKTIQ